LVFVTVASFVPAVCSPNCPPPRISLLSILQPGKQLQCQRPRRG
jgi:hypothetical protein